MYKKTDYELAETILKVVEEKTGLTATCGIGPNMLLAKVAMDIDAKKYKNGIAKWTYDDIPEKLWTITPLSKMWGIGPNMEKKLNDLMQEEINLLNLGGYSFPSGHSFLAISFYGFMIFLINVMVNL